MTHSFLVSHSTNAEEHYRHMTTGSVPALILSLAAPSVISNLVTTAYNLADTYFIGHISTAASGAIGVAFVLMTMIQAAGFYFGQGTGNAISRHLGAKELEKAQVIASTGIAAVFCCGIIIAIIGHVFLDQLCMLAGATPTILPYARIYMSLILLGAPWMATSLTLNQQLRFEGLAFFSMVALSTGALVNFGLAPLLIFTCNMGIAGAGLATILCQALSFCLLIVGNQRFGIVHLSFKDVRPTLALAREINNGGLPSLARQIVAGFAITILNNSARPFGDAAIAAIGETQRIINLGNILQIGIGQGMQPVCGFNYGARQFNRVREALKSSIILAFVVVGIVCIPLHMFAPNILPLFRNDPQVIDIAVRMMRIQTLTLPITGLAMLTNFCLQTTGRMIRATLLGLARLGIILAPTVLVMAHFFGLTGIELSQSVSDTITTLIAIPMLIQFYQEIRSAQSAGEKTGAHHSTTACKA